jgi:hypothetical protein
MYVYNYRAFDRFDRKTISLAVLADDSPSWKPDHFSYELWGCKAGLWFPSVKLLECGKRWDVLEKSKNPFASVVMAHLKALETACDWHDRYRWKLYLIKRLYRAGLEKKDVIALFEFIDWAMSMPRELESGLWREIEKIERERKVEYITSVERIGMEKGMKKGGANVLQLIVSQRFHTPPDAVKSIFEGLSAEQIEVLAARFMEAQSLDDLRKWADEMRGSSRDE